MGFENEAVRWVGSGTPDEAWEAMRGPALPSSTGTGAIKLLLGAILGMCGEKAAGDALMESGLRDLAPVLGLGAKVLVDRKPEGAMWRQTGVGEA